MKIRFFLLGDIDQLFVIVKRKCRLGLKFSVVYATTVERRIKGIVSSLQTDKYFLSDKVYFLMYICYVIGAANFTIRCHYTKLINQSTTTNMTNF